MTNEAATRRGSLRRQLIVGNVLALALLLGALGVVIRYTVRSFLTASVDGDLNRRLRFVPPPPRGKNLPPGGALARSPRDGPPPGDRPPDRGGRRPAPWDDTLNYGYHHFDLQGRSVVPIDRRPLWDPVGHAVAARGQMIHATVIVDGEPLRVVSAPFREGGNITAVVQIAHPMADIERAIEGVDHALLALIPIGLICAGLAGAYLTDRVLLRVRRTTRAAEQLGAGDLSARLPVTGNDEFSELAETFNGLLGRLETAFGQQERLLEQQRRFTADASHELKTPLTVIKGTASMALGGGPGQAGYERSLQDIDRAADVMSHLVGDLLLLARSDAGQLGRNPIVLPVREVLEQAVSGLLPGGAPITLDVEDEALCVLGNETELVRLFSNLLDNAADHTPPEGAICVAARAEDERVVVSVSDTGAGIAPEHLPHLGERFYRADAARSRADGGGTGLGLSICKSIVEAHGGGMEIESAPGKGTTVHVILPRPAELPLASAG